MPKRKCSVCYCYFFSAWEVARYCSPECRKEGQVMRKRRQRERQKARLRGELPDWEDPRPYNWLRIPRQANLVNPEGFYFSQR